MSYPEKGASYDHNPKFIERMKAAERADGGIAQGENLQSVEAPMKLLRPQPQDLADQAFGRAYRTFGDAYSPSKQSGKHRGGEVRKGD